MKTLLLKLSVFFCICCATASAFAAKDLYISSTGNDENDGKTEAAPVKTLRQIHKLIGVGDIIHVSGIIDVSLEVKGDSVGMNFQQGLNKDLNGGFLFGAGIWNNVKMLGTDPEKDGFTSKGDGRIFRIDGGNHTFENLLFTEGADIANDGGCGIWIRGGATITNTFINCRFVKNQAKLDEAGSAFTGTNGRGGAVHIMNSRVIFKNCYFAENANTQGSAIFWHGGTIDILGCIFENHHLSTVSGTTGGALYSWSEQAQEPVVTIDRCIFRNNDVAGDGGAITLNNRNDRENNVKLVLNITNCAFIGNESFNNGGAIHHNNTRAVTNDSILIANTTFLGNTAQNFGGAIFLGQAQPNSIFTMVNSSVISNYTYGNGGHGAGLTIYQTNTSNMLKRIYNCIFDKNSSITQQIYSDFNYRRTDDAPVPGENSSGEKEFIISNTYISTTLNGNGVNGSWFTNENYPGNSINYTRVEYVEPEWIVDYVNASGIDNDPEYYLQADFPTYAIPLQDDAPARTFGNAAYLTQFGISATDQLGKARVIDGSACAVGASEATQEEIETVAFEDYPAINLNTSIRKISDGKPAGEFTIAGNIISLKNKELQNTGLTLYNLTGSIVRTGTEQLSIADLPGGLYIVRAKVTGRNLVQKILK
ncbi:MAG: T9SS type A sorting domain-containing protein [Bacteroidales bacterium]|jgi:hypothetical protein|nr:T9SS type A sorting domain-containing protein [Bacteroidales bacterium]